MCIIRIDAGRQPRTMTFDLQLNKMEKWEMFLRDLSVLIVSIADRNEGATASTAESRHENKQLSSFINNLFIPVHAIYKVYTCTSSSGTSFLSPNSHSHFVHSLYTDSQSAIIQHHFHFL